MNTLNDEVFVLCPVEFFRVDVPENVFSDVRSCDISGVRSALVDQVIGLDNREETLFEMEGFVEF